MQPGRKPEGRTYSDYESVNECLEGKNKTGTVTASYGSLFQVAMLRGRNCFVTKGSWNGSAKRVLHGYEVGAKVQCNYANYA